MKGWAEFSTTTIGGRPRRSAEFSYHTVTTESKPPEFLEAGASFYQPPGEWNAVATEGAKTLVFRVLEKGQPMIISVDSYRTINR